MMAHRPKQLHQPMQGSLSILKKFVINIEKSEGFIYKNLDFRAEISASEST